MSHIPHSRVKANQKVDLWDMGPPRPDAPKEPTKVDPKLTGAEKAEAEVLYEDALEAYKNDLRNWSATKAAHRQWHEKQGGPRKEELWAADARHAMTVEPDRWKLDLPKGTKPGRAQIEAEQQQAAEREALEHEVEADPQFGSKGA